MVLMTSQSHARLSPSSAETWIPCPASVRLAAQFPDTSSRYAEEGTAAHALGEIRASAMLGDIDAVAEAEALAHWLEHVWEPLRLGEEELEDMNRHVDSYLALIDERRKLYPWSVVLLEQRVQTGIPDCWGTADVVIVSPEHVEVIDLKYGQGVPVPAEGNPQLRLYGVGALDTYGDVLGETEVVRITVFQPRLGSTSTEELAAEELREWRDTVALPAAQEAGREDARFGPSESACRWCPASGFCRAQVEAATSVDFGTDPDLLSPAEIAEQLQRVGLLRDWLKAFDEAALDLAYSQGVSIPGWKVVRSGGRRSITDDAAAVQTLIDAGYPAEKVARLRAETLGTLEKVVGRKELPAILGGLLVKSEGSPSLVRESDSRPSIQPNTEAVKEFSDE